MHKNNSFGCYIPKISRSAVFVLRRLAWLQGWPMTKTLDRLILDTVPTLNLTAVCTACKGTDEQCEDCIILEGVVSSKENTPPKAAC